MQYMWRNDRSKDWERLLDRRSSPKTKRKFRPERSLLENQGIKEHDFITLVFKWSLLGVHSSLIKSYVDASMGRQKHGKTANDCFDNILLHLRQWYALRWNFSWDHTPFFETTVLNNVSDGTTLLNKYR